MSDIKDIQKELDEHIKSLEATDAAFFAREEIIKFENENVSSVIPLLTYLGSIAIVFVVGCAVGSYMTMHSIQSYAAVHNATQVVEAIATWR